MASLSSSTTEGRPPWLPLRAAVSSPSNVFSRMPSRSTSAATANGQGDRNAEGDQCRRSAATAVADRTERGGTSRAAKRGNGLGGTPVEIPRTGRPSTWDVRTPLRFNPATGRKERYRTGTRTRPKRNGRCASGTPTTRQAPSHPAPTRPWGSSWVDGRPSIGARTPRRRGTSRRSGCSAPGRPPHPQHHLGCAGLGDRTEEAPHGHPGPHRQPADRAADQGGYAGLADPRRSRDGALPPRDMEAVRQPGL